MTIIWLNKPVFSISSIHYQSFHILAATDQTVASLPYVQFTFEILGICYRSYRDHESSHPFDLFVYFD